VRADLDVTVGTDAGKSRSTPHRDRVGHTNRLFHRNLAERGPLAALQRIRILNFNKRDSLSRERAFERELFCAF
jgi:hypothetical protein